MRTWVMRSRLSPRAATPDATNTSLAPAAGLLEGALTCGLATPLCGGLPQLALLGL